MNSLSRFQPALLSLFRFITGLLLFQYGIAKIFKFPAVPYFADIPPLIWTAGALELVLGAALMLGLLTRITAFILADYCWGIAAFRPDRDPQLISLLNDMAWFFFIAPVGTIIVQNLCLAISIYLDARSDPIFPRWVAHFNIVISALLIPSAFSILHKSGPLAWNGAVSFTLRLSVFAIYIVVMFVVLLGVVNRQGSEREALA